MKTLRLDEDFEKEAARIIGKFPAPGHAIQTIDSTFDPETRLISRDGSIIGVLLCNVIPRHLYRPAYKLLKKVDDLPTNRIAAMGTNSLHRELRSDDMPSLRLGVNEHVVHANPAREGRLGFDKRGMKTKLTRRHPEMLGKSKRLIRLVDSLYRQFRPTAYERQRAVLEELPQFRLFGTVFTSLYVAKNFRTGYHRDSNNLPEVVTALTVLRSSEGGELLLPRFRVAIALKPGDLLFFDPEQVHGNLPFADKRLSVAFYCGGWVPDFDRRR
jgi:hypothetical protein